MAKGKPARKWSWSWGGVLRITGIVFGVLVVIMFFPRPAEKAIRTEIRPAYELSDPIFLQSLSHLIGAPMTEGNRITPLQNGVEIFPPMLEAIRGATNSVTLENFIFRSGALGTQFVSALTERARAKVKVHLIIDSMGGSRLAQDELKTMIDAGVHVVKYNRTEWHKLLRVNHRDHRKILVVDGRVGFTGGACIADEWMGNADAPTRWRDTNFRVEGPAVAQLQGIFMDNWTQAEHEVLHGPEYFPLLTNYPGGIRALCFRTGPRDGVETARLAHLYSIAAARRNIRITHAYFLPDDLMIQTLLSARKRGVEIEIITPGIIDANVVRRASRARWSDLLDAGVKFYEYQPALLHCKVMVVDDIWVLGGTVNFDNRSFRLNDENNIGIWDRAFAGNLVKVFEADKAKAKPIIAAEFHQRPWYTKVAEEVASWFRNWM